MRTNRALAAQSRRQRKTACWKRLPRRSLPQRRGAPPCGWPSSLSLRGTRGRGSLIETSSTYVVMPCTLVFVLNARPSAFAHAGSCDRAMIGMLPVMALLLRALVICRRVAQLTSADQKLLYVSSACSCLISGALGVSFAAAADARQSALSFESATLPQCIVCAVVGSHRCSNGRASHGNSSVRLPQHRLTVVAFRFACLFGRVLLPSARAASGHGALSTALLQLRRSPAYSLSRLLSSSRRWPWSSLASRLRAKTPQPTWKAPVLWSAASRSSPDARKISRCCCTTPPSS
jgi:hypothetical protein